MAWDTVLTERLRYYINDLDATNYTWTDNQLKKFLVLAASLLFGNELKEFNTQIGGPYTVDTSASTITPDPVDNQPEGVGNLIVMKAACLIARSEYKRAGAVGGYLIVDDKSTIDTRGAVESAKSLADDACKAFSDSLSDFKRGNFAVNIKAVLSPFTPANTWWGQGYPRISPR